MIAKKAKLAHGEWLPWLKANAGVLGFSTPQTEGKLMKTAKLYVNVQFDEATAIVVSRQPQRRFQIRSRLRIWAEAGRLPSCV